MVKMQRQVAMFNAATGAERVEDDKHGHYIGVPMIRAADLRAALILEEACETVAALVGTKKAASMLYNAFDQYWMASKEDPTGPDLVEAVDGGADLLFVTFGMFDAIGVDAEEPFDLVTQANMTKVGAPRDANGKTQKPPGFVPPQERIRELLVKLGAKL